MTDLLGVTNVEHPKMPAMASFTIEPKRSKVWKGSSMSYPRLSSEGPNELDEAIALSLALPQPASSSHQGHVPFLGPDGLMTYSIYGNAPHLSAFGQEATWGASPVTPPPRGVKGQLNVETPLQNKKPRPESDLNAGFRDAYDNKSGLAYDDKNKILYIAGMRANPNDVVAGWDSAINPVALKHSQRWQDAMRFIIKHPEIKKIRGHSMGGVVASQMSEILTRNKRYGHVTYESYNSPFSPINPPSTKIKRWRHVGDIVSMQDAGAEEVNFGNFWDLLAQHDYAGFDH